MSDLISREAAINAICEHGTELERMGITVLAVSNHKQVTVDLLESLPSAQPKIIHCKDCKWKQGSECVRFADVRPFPNDFCSRAERRTDE